ncbi:hypothetical protein AMTR_s00055p00179190 [Amborella trichopoda]|uniref:NB-ARC domain-containing protein n=1 Tax=Amborella trichopoda TaxID=13333 RepID=U5D760_AMBTC|nr:hypothetical protein AMTR_s00055p00179190 [Amborella trichopoda]
MPASAPQGESDIMGIDETVSKLNDWLLNGELKRRVLLVWGMGGIGKTTLIRRICNSIMSTFVYSAWSLCHHPLAKWAYFNMFLDNLVQQEVRRGAQLKLLDCLNNHVYGKRFLVVCDDVKEENMWDFINFALSEDRNRSRIIMATRDKCITKMVNVQCYIYPIEPMQERVPFDLFARRNFQKDLEEVVQKTLRNW